MSKTLLTLVFQTRDIQLAPKIYEPQQMDVGKVIYQEAKDFISHSPEI